MTESMKSLEDVKYIIRTKTGTTSGADTDAGGSVWARIGGLEGSTDQFDLDNGKNNFILGKTDVFELEATRSAIGNVGTPIFLELFLHKNSDGTDGWYYNGIEVEYWVCGEKKSTSHFIRHGWLDDELGSPTVRLWEKNLDGKKGTTTEILDVVAKVSWIYDNRGNPRDVKKNTTDEYRITREEWDQLVTSKSASNELSVSMGSEAFGVEWSAEAKSTVATGKEKTESNRQEVIENKQLTEELIVPANSLMIYRYVLVVQSKKTSYPFEGKSLVRKAPVAGSLHKKYAEIHVFGKNEKIPQEYQDEIDNAARLINA